MKFRTAALATIAAATALAVPGTALASTGDGGGGSAPFTINNSTFIAYSCTPHSTYVWGPNYRTGSRYNCDGGVYVKATGGRHPQPKCVSSDQYWSWTGGRC